MMAMAMIAICAHNGLVVHACADGVRDERVCVCVCVCVATRSAGSLDTTDLEGRGELRVSKEESDLNSSTGSDLGEGSEDDEFGKRRTTRPTTRTRHGAG